MTGGSSGGDAVASGSAGDGESLIGRVLDGRYRIDAVLGTGGVGVVYRGEHTSLGRPVAIKVLHEYFGDREDLLLRFEREAKVLSNLSHPHVVAITDYGVAEGMPYLAMELLEGQTLHELLRARRHVDPNVALDIARGILRGMAFAHARGVLHRDLKPANVFLQKLPDDPYHVKLLDFGLAKIVEAEDEAIDELTLTRSGTVLGTPAYMSPEQASGATVDAQTDVYSAGCVLYELFAGRPPFTADTRPELIRMHMLSEVPPIEDVRPGAEPRPELERVLFRALAKDPRLRFSDAGEMLEAVDALPRPPLAGVQAASQEPPRRPASGSHRTRPDGSEAPTLSGRSPGTPPPAQQPPPPARSFRWAGVVSVVVGLAVVGAGAFLAWESATPEDEGAEDLAGPPEEISLVGGEGEPGEAEPEPVAEEATAAGGAAAADGPDEPPPADETEEAEPGPDEAAPEAAEPDRPEPRYLLAGNLPGMLRPYWARVRRGRPLARAHHRTLRRYQQRFDEDPRPSLLLGHDYSQRGWYSDALTRYQHAYELDPSSRGDPVMLRNLLHMAATEALERQAGDAVAEIYGREALDAIDGAKRREESPDADERLEELRRRLAR